MITLEMMPPLMFGGLVLAMLIGFPVAFTLAAVGLSFGFLAIHQGFFDLNFLQAIPGRVFGSVLFRAPLEEYLKDGVGQFVVDGVGFLTTYGDGRWVLMLEDREYDEPELRQKIFQAIGRDDLEVEIITTGRWTITVRSLPTSECTPSEVIRRFPP